MAKKNNERRSYTKEFKTEAVALAGKKEKPISQVAKDLGLNENVLKSVIRLKTWKRRNDGNGNSRNDW